MPPLTVGVLLFDGFEPLDWVGPVNIWAMLNYSSSGSGSSSTAAGSSSGGSGDAAVRFVYIAEAGPGGRVTSVTGAMTVVATAGLDDDNGDEQQQHLDWLLVPGGIGTRREVGNAALLAWLRAAAARPRLRLLMSVCTGSALLSAAGLLDGRRATSNKSVFDWVAGVVPSSSSGSSGAGEPVQWQRRARWVVEPRGPAVAAAAAAAVGGADGGAAGEPPQPPLLITSSGVSAGMDAAVCAMRMLLGAEAAAGAAARIEYAPSVDAAADEFADRAYRPAVE